VKAHFRIVQEYSTVHNRNIFSIQVRRWLGWRQIDYGLSLEQVKEALAKRTPKPSKVIATYSEYGTLIFFEGQLKLENVIAR
jgi:hypothetical protein